MNKGGDTLMRAWSAIGRNVTVLAGAALLCATMGSGPARADAVVRVGKAVAGVFDFVPLDVGINEGIFKKHGLDVQEFNFGGAAKLHQAMAAKSIDVGLGGGPELAFVEKGEPVMGVAAMMGAPTLVLFVHKDPALAKLADLKGKKVSVSTVGSLTAWLAHQLNRSQGWDGKGLDVVALGSISARISALRAGQTESGILDIVHATVLQKEGVGHIMLRFSSIVPNFITHVIFARDDFMKSDPKALSAFLAGWFDTISYMRAHKAETVKVAAKVMHQPDDIVGTAYDVTMPVFSDTGKFEPKALAVLRSSFVEMKWLPKAPDMKTLYTEKFLPHKGS
jgi:ABC-type nitrate/sulfonate/bicarbonate transport system substrate-binding protein